MMRRGTMSPEGADDAKGAAAEHLASLRRCGQRARRKLHRLVRRHAPAAVQRLLFARGGKGRSPFSAAAPGEELFPQSRRKLIISPGSELVAARVLQRHGRARLRRLVVGSLRNVFQSGRAARDERSAFGGVDDAIDVDAQALMRRPPVAMNACWQADTVGALHLCDYACSDLRTATA